MLERTLGTRKIHKHAASGKSLLHIRAHRNASFPAGRFPGIVSNVRITGYLQSRAEFEVATVQNCLDQRAPHPTAAACHCYFHACMPLPRRSDAASLKAMRSSVLKIIRRGYQKLAPPSATPPRAASRAHKPILSSILPKKPRSFGASFFSSAALPAGVAALTVLSGFALEVLSLPGESAVGTGGFSAGLATSGCTGLVAGLSAGLTGSCDLSLTTTSPSRRASLSSWKITVSLRRSSGL